MNGDMNLPFEPQEPTESHEDFALSGGVVVMSALVPTDDGLEPVIVFRFARADGSGFMPPIALGFEADQVDGFTLLIRQAMERALEAAS
jgi:hypothetical protein